MRRTGSDHRGAGIGVEEVVGTVEREGQVLLVGSKHALGPFGS